MYGLLLTHDEPYANNTNIKDPYRTNGLHTSAKNLPFSGYYRNNASNLIDCAYIFHVIAYWPPSERPYKRAKHSSRSIELLGDRNLLIFLLRTLE